METGIAARDCPVPVGMLFDISKPRGAGSIEPGQVT
jgi:hypothetical protein